MLQEIQRENETYYSLLREALPPGPAREEAFNPAPRAGGGRQGWSRGEQEKECQQKEKRTRT